MVPVLRCRKSRSPDNHGRGPQQGTWGCPD